MSRATVSVIVPCYRYGHLLEGCVESVLSQEGVEVQVLIIDDRSPDDSFEMASEIAMRREHVQARRHGENVGLIETANEGLRWARGEYVLLLSADDLLTPGSLWRATTALKRHSKAGMAYGRALLAREGRPLPEPAGRWRATAVWHGGEWIERRCRSAHNCISSPEVLVRRSVQRQVGDYDPACRHTSDLNMWLRIAAVSNVAHIRGIPQAVYRVHGDSMLRSQRDPIVELRERRIAFERFFERCSARLEDPRGLARAVGEALARQALWQASRAVDRNEDAALAQALQDFALDVCPQAQRLREWRGLSLRRTIGAGRSRLFPPFLATGAGHRLRGHIGRARWRLTGV